MGIFRKDRELFKPEYNNDYTIHSGSYRSDNQNVGARCRIDNLQKIWTKNFLLITILPVLFIIGSSMLASWTGNYDIF